MGVVPCWDWIDGNGIKILVYNCPFDFVRKFHIINRMNPSLGDKFDIFKPKHFVLIYMGQNLLVKEWKEIEAKKIESMKDVT